MEEFDETKAVEYIRQHANRDLTKYSDDDILNIIDMIWDFYEINGLLEIDADITEEPEDDMVPDIIAYVGRMLKKDKASQVSIDDVPGIVNAEIEYEDSID